MTKNKLRVWIIRNVPNVPTYKNIETIDEGKSIIKKAIRKDLKDSSIESNVFGIEEWMEVDGKFQWCEWYSDETGMDIMDTIDEEDEAN